MKPGDWVVRVERDATGRITKRWGTRGRVLRTRPRHWKRVQVRWNGAAGVQTHMWYQLEVCR